MGTGQGQQRWVKGSAAMPAGAGCGGVRGQKRGGGVAEGGARLVRNHAVAGQGENGGRGRSCGDSHTRAVPTVGDGLCKKRAGRDSGGR